MASIIQFRPYQLAAFECRTTGLELWFWSRQIGKSFTLAAWAVDRLLTRPGRLVTILSNSRENGAELNLKCAEVCAKLDKAYEQEDLSPDTRYENMNMETRVTVKKKTGRIKVLAANPRTARGFSGDLILDEFAFHEDSRAIWEAAEPILSSNPDFLCRIASTPNGKQNMFYTLVSGGLLPVRKCRRSDAWKQGLKIYHPVTRQPITPDEARELAVDKRAYDQNYELIWADENMALLTYELIGEAEQADAGTVCVNDWTADVLEGLHDPEGDLFAGIDVGRSRDWTVITILERLGPVHVARAVLRIENMRLPQQQMRLDAVLALPRLRKACIDMTGIGLGLCEYAQEKWGHKVEGINFATTVPTTDALQGSGRSGARVKVTESMATELLRVFEDRRIKIPVDPILREDLRKPEKVITPGGRVSIAADRTGAGHADHFWSLALALEAAGSVTAPGPMKAIQRGGARAMDRRIREVTA